MKTVVVTGATSGIGFAVCRELLREGFFVIGIGRSDEKCANSKKELSESFPDWRSATNTFLYIYP